ncbi:MAG: 4-hydroxythreonine-4-phosphate dehydrogenase PdxA [Clostridia bacterium]|jgi:4-hydroxythreonine-4-phosphate dehydrogenase|nr:4-hydroxythreonine-4-phosphate dehydrogenase PdxA [Clostridia bacterium]
MLIGITMGDAGGVGPEIVLKAHRNGEIGGDFILIGDYEIIEYCNELLGYQVALKRIHEPAERDASFLNVLDLGLLKKERLEIGRISAAAGDAAYRYVEKAAELALAKKIDALVTLPMNKEATRLTQPEFTGHTELLAALCGRENYTMMLVSEKLTVSHVSTHVSMLEAVQQVTAERVYDVIKLTHDALQKSLPIPRIAVAGLNPHAGENGAFGEEEREEIIPAVEKARQEGIRAEGPLAPDTVFLKAVRKQYDAVVCMYHDQGHIPMKLLDFEGGVNVTLGLQVVRTSVDHGTAYDIAYQGKASCQSFISAYRQAEKIIRGT